MRLVVSSRLLPLVFATALGLSSAAAAQSFFSVDAASPSVPGVNNSDVLAPGVPLVVAVPAAANGIAGAPFDELNAMTAGGPLGVLLFSVDRAAVGIPGGPPDVASEAAAGQAAGDVFTSALGGANGLVINQALQGLIPAAPPGAPVVPPIDDLDALDVPGMPPVLFALAPGHPLLGASALVGCGADLFGPGGGPAIPFGALGLGACADDIDALHLDAGTGDLYFSLAPGSPSLAPGSPIAGCGGGCSPADVFIAIGGVGPSGIFAPAGALGLLPTDNLNALAFDPPPPPTVVPLMPIWAFALLVVALIGVTWWLRPGRSRSS